MSNFLALSESQQPGKIVVVGVLVVAGVAQVSW